jgi:NAD(P)-dependent dehydrogenase (short-subunit alcohol dehydrogenase family)
MKTILLIGGSQGIGFEIVKQIKDDYDVIVASRSKGELEDMDIKHLEFDAMEDSVDDLDLPDVIDGLVYLPGSINLKPFKMMSLKTYEEDFQLNFMSLVKVVHGLLPKLKKSDQASLVFLSTVAVQLGMPFHTSVAAAKGAIEGFSRALAAEYAPSIRVNVIAPSLVNTELAGNMLGNDKKKEKMDKRHPLNRVGEAEDIANMATFLLSDKSSWMSGQVLGVDGGMSSLNIQ